MRVTRLLTSTCSVLLAGAAALGVAAPAAGAASTHQQSAPVVETLGVAESPDSQFFNLLNGVRSDLGLPAFRYDTGLSAYAIAHAQAMARAGGLYHSNIGSLLGPWSSVGENVGVGGSVYQVHVALVYSPGHYANMTNPSFNAVGIGVAVDAYGRVFTCHVFAA